MVIKIKEQYFEIILDESLKAFNENEIPVGALMTYKDEIIAISHNTKEQNQCCLNHAEINVIEYASKKLKTWRLSECDLYITMEPCVMCCGAIAQARIKSVYYLINNPKYGGLENNSKIFKNSNTNVVKINNLKYEKQIKILLKKFFSDKR